MLASPGVARFQHAPPGRPFPRPPAPAAVPPPAKSPWSTSSEYPLEPDVVGGFERLTSAGACRPWSKRRPRLPEMMLVIRRCLGSSAAAVPHTQGSLLGAASGTMRILVIRELDDCPLVRPLEPLPQGPRVIVEVGLVVD